MKPAPLALGILGSGKGSNCRAILQAIADGKINATGRIVISDVAGAGILEIAREFCVSDLFVPPGKFRTRLEPENEQNLVRLLLGAGVELVVLAGFMRVLKDPMLTAFPQRIINIHPSLLPKFPGVESWKQALLAGEAVAGCTVHYVDAGIDSGAIIARREVPVQLTDTPETLHARIQVAERELFPLVIGQLASELRPS